MDETDAMLGIGPERRDFKLVPGETVLLESAFPLVTTQELAKTLLPPTTFQAAFDLYRQRLEELLREFQQAVAPVPLTEVVTELHTTPRMAHLPQVDTSALRAWLDKAMLQPRSITDYRQMMLVYDELNRFEAMTEQFAKWWAQQVATDGD